MTRDQFTALKPGQVVTYGPMPGWRVKLLRQDEGIWRGILHRGDLEIGRILLYRWCSAALEVVGG